MSKRSPARAQFAAVVADEDDRIDLARAALLISVEDDPGWSVEAAVAAIDGLAAGLGDSLFERAPHAQVERLASFLHDESGFTGDQEDYYHPRNALLTQVLARRTGIPITLALIYMEVARRHGIHLLPIGLPGHLVVRHARDRDAYIDPYFGAALTEEACVERVLGVGNVETLSPDLLEPLAPRPFLLRLLNNLKGAYLRSEPVNLPGAIGACDRILLVYPTAYEELRDRGLLLMQLDQHLAALECFERYLSLAPEAGDADQIRSHAQALYQQLARLN
jgi:regulator of sirC expression with transglutaminase-like and TPR domain